MKLLKIDAETITLFNSLADTQFFKKYISKANVYKVNGEMWYVYDETKLFEECYNITKDTEELMYLLSKKIGEMKLEKNELDKKRYTDKMEKHYQEMKEKEEKWDNYAKQHNCGIYYQHVT